MALIDLTGQKFNRWTVERLSPASGKMKYWDCVCECGTRRSVFGGDLKRGGSKSCGCHMKEVNADRYRSHGMSRHPAYRSWQFARQRCENPALDSFKDYGGRGITVCDRWRSFENFWADMGDTWLPGLSIERDDVNGNYEPGNCSWATPKEQAHNRRDNRIINTREGPMDVTDASERFGISRITIFSRIRYGWPEHRLLEPIRSRDPNRKPKLE